MHILFPEHHCIRNLLISHRLYKPNSWCTVVVQVSATQSPITPKNPPPADHHQRAVDVRAAAKAPPRQIGTRHTYDMITIPRLRISQNKSQPWFARALSHTPTARIVVTSHKIKYPRTMPKGGVYSERGVAWSLAMCRV